MAANDYVGLGVFLGILFLLVAMAWSRVYVNRKLCRKEFDRSIRERLATEYGALIDAGLSDVVADHFKGLVQEFAMHGPGGMLPDIDVEGKLAGAVEAKDKANQYGNELFDSYERQKKGKGQNSSGQDPIQQTIDRIFTELGVKDVELKEAAEAITECPTATTEVFWVVVALAITAVGVGLGYWAYTRWSYVPDPKDVCSLNIYNCEDVAEFCHRPVSDSDYKQCYEYCRTRTPYDPDCIPQHCDSEIAKVIASNGVLYDREDILANCEVQCAQRAEEGIASYECKSLLCSLPLSEPDDYFSTCDTFCKNPSARYGLYCIDRVCGDSEEGACACHLYLKEGKESAKLDCVTYCNENPSEDLCMEFFCEVDPILGCAQQCGEGTRHCAPEEITGEPVHFYQRERHAFVTTHLRLGDVGGELYLTNRDSSQNLYALSVGNSFVGMNAARQAVLVDTEAEALLFNVLSQGTPYIYIFQTQPVQVSPGYYANLYLSYTQFGCVGTRYLSWITKPPRTKMALVEWWVAPKDVEPVEY